MRKRSKVFCIVTAASLGTLGALPALVSACGAEGEASGESPFGDGGTTSETDSGAQVDAAPASDGASFNDAGAIPPPDAGLPTSILAVHASANLFPFRLCFGAAGGVLPLPPYPDDPAQSMPETNFPGVPVGGAARVPPIQLTGDAVTLYLVPAAQLDTDVSTNAAEQTCDQLICSGGGCLATNDYARIDSVTLPPGGVVLAVEGCAAQAFADASAAQCGATYDAVKGNLSAVVSRLAPSATTPADASGSFALQLAQLSTSFSGGTGPSLTFVDPTIDASVSLTAPGVGVGVSAGTVTLPISEAGVMAAYFVIGPASGAPVIESLAAVQYFQAPGGNPVTYFNGQGAYLGAIVGDVTDASAPVSLPDGAPNPAFDGHGLHVIAYPEVGK